MISGMDTTAISTPQAVIPLNVSGSGIVKQENNETPSPRAALVENWTQKVLRALQFHKKSFDQIKQDILFARGEQWQGGNGGKYVTNIVQRHLQQTTAALYAKNPTFIATRRKTLDFKLWDGSQGSLQMLQAQMSKPTVLPSGQPDPNAMALMQDISQGISKQKMMDRLAETMEIVADYVVRQQQPPFKSQMKQAVRRAKTCTVAYVKIGYQRSMEPRPEDADKITDISSRLREMEVEMSNLAEDSRANAEADMERLRLQLEDLEANSQMQVTNEGPVFDFPRTRSIIIDPRCSQIKGFIGAQWVAQEYILTTDDVKSIYGVDLGSNFKQYDLTTDRTDNKIADNKCATRCRVWEIYNKNDQMVYVVCEGHNDFLQEPASPKIKIRRFWPWFDLIFNENEDEDNIYPPSDVQLMRSQQIEYNKSRDGLKDHRHANFPLTATTAGAIDDEDKKKIRSARPNEIIELRGLPPGGKIDDLFQTVKKPPIDPALYDVNQYFDDITRVVGTQEANLGGTSGATATESSISESSRMSSLSSNIDDLDSTMSEMAQALGEVMLMEMSPETVTKIAGPGAVWPQLTAQEISDQLYLDIEAGSSGRPNKASELDAFTKIAPLLMQIPGISPEFVARLAIRRVDDKLDPTDAIVSGIPSILAMNAANQMPQGGVSDDPNQQGAEGSNNSQKPPEQPPMGGGSPIIPQ